MNLGTCQNSKVSDARLFELRCSQLPRTHLIYSLGGSLSGWGGPGLDGCYTLTGPDFQDVFYKSLWAANAKLLNYYMVYGLVPRLRCSPAVQFGAH